MTHQHKTAVNGDDEHERLVDETVKFLLIMDQKKLPIKRADINKHILKDCVKAFPTIITEATKRLSTVFGLRLVELKDKHKGSYIIVTELSSDHDGTEEDNVNTEDANVQNNAASSLDDVTITDDDSVEDPDINKENANRGLLMVVLSVIFMSGNVVTESQLWSALSKFEIDQDSSHEVFGDVKKLILTEWVRQCYIDFTRQPNTDPPICEIRWGQRAFLETSKRKVLNFVSQVYGVPALRWESQWQDILQSEMNTPDNNTGNARKSQKKKS